nr:MAG TPA: hypothetical protein [Caudoviricetes sp.]
MIQNLNKNRGCSYLNQAFTPSHNRLATPTAFVNL